MLWVIQGVDSEAMSEDGGTEQNNMFVWGTNLNIADIQNRIRRFMRSFTQEGSNEALYTTLIKQVSSCRTLTVSLLKHHADSCVGVSVSGYGVSPDKASYMVRF